MSMRLLFFLKDNYHNLNQFLFFRKTIWNVFKVTTLVSIGLQFLKTIINSLFLRTLDLSSATTTTSAEMRLTKFRSKLWERNLMIYTKAYSFDSKIANQQSKKVLMTLNSCGGYWWCIKYLTQLSNLLQ